MGLFREMPIDLYLQEEGRSGRYSNIVVPRLKVITAPTGLPVTLLLLKEYLRIDGEDENPTLTALLGAAVSQAEAFMGRALMQRTLQAWYDQPPASGWLPLVYAPIISIDEFLSYDDTDESTEVDSTVYFADVVSEPGRIILRRGEVWPTNLRIANSLAITYKCGYASADLIPAAIVQGILLLCAQWYEGKDAQKLEDTFMQISHIPPAVRAVLMPYVVPRFED